MLVIAMMKSNLFLLDNWDKLSLKWLL